MYVVRYVMNTNHKPQTTNHNNQTNDNGIKTCHRFAVVLQLEVKMNIILFDS